MRTSIPFCIVWLLFVIVVILALVPILTVGEMKAEDIEVIETQQYVDPDPGVPAYMLLD